jgi:effector-binding domain-containing protein
MPTFEIAEREAQPAAVVRGNVPMDQLPDFFGSAFTAVMAELASQGVAPAGPPFGFYPSAPGDVVELCAGFPVTAAIEPAGEVEAMELPAGRVATGVHVGPYDTLEVTYRDLVAWMAQEGLAPGSAMWENYVTDPDTAPPEEWRTEIVLPIKG